MSNTSPERALAEAASELVRRNQRFALVGGLAVSIRGEVRFTRDVDLAIAVSGDAQVEALVRLPYRPAGEGPAGLSAEARKASMTVARWARSDL